jgi:hypothetical protein
VIGMTDSSTVVGIQGRGVSNAMPSNGQALVWNQTGSRWEPRDVTIDASQIVSGTLADARVAQSNVTQHQGALQLSASQITSGVLPLVRGGTGQSAWTAGTCVQVSADGTRLESTSGPCGTGSGGGVGGSGDAGSIAMWTDSTTLGNSAITESASDVSFSKPIKAQLWDRGGAVFNVKAFGAVGNGSADDTAALQAAINAAQAVGGTVYLPAGIYRVTSPVQITNKVAIVGDNSRSSILWTNSTTTGVVAINTTDSVILRDLQFGGPTNATAGSLVSITGGTPYGNVGSKILNCLFYGGYDQLNVDAAISLIVEGNRFGTCARYQLRLNNSYNPDYSGVLVAGNSFSDSTGAGIHIDGICGVRIVHNYFLFGSNAIEMSYTADVTTGGMVIANNFFDQFSTSAITLTQSGSGGFSSVIIRGNHMSAASGNNRKMISISGNFSGLIDGNSIGCTFGQSGEVGIYVATARGVWSIANNTIAACGTAISATPGNDLVSISNNSYYWMASTPIVGNSYTRVTETNLTYANLGAWANGSLVYCTDCTVAATCASGGTGAFAKRINGTWVCSDSGGSGSWNPIDDTVLWFREDFPTVTTTNNQIGTYGWTSSCSSGTVSVVSRTGASPFKKVYRMETGATSGNLCQISLGSSGTTATTLGALGSYGSWDSIFYFRHNSAASTNLGLFVGYLVGGSNMPGAGAATARIGVEYDTSRGDTNFMFVACNGSNCTRQSSGVSFDTAWHKLRIRSQTAGTILFSLDEGTEVSINTNVPTSALAPFFGVRTAEAAAKRVEADRWYWSGPNQQ